MNVEKPRSSLRYGAVSPVCYHSVSLLLLLFCSAQIALVFYSSFGSTRVAAMMARQSMALFAFLCNHFSLVYAGLRILAILILLGEGILFVRTLRSPKPTAFPHLLTAAGISLWLLLDPGKISLAPGVDSYPNSDSIPLRMFVLLFLPPAAFALRYLRPIGGRTVSDEEPQRASKAQARPSWGIEALTLAAVASLAAGGVALADTAAAILLRSQRVPSDLPLTGAAALGVGCAVGLILAPCLLLTWFLPIKAERSAVFRFLLSSGIAFVITFPVLLWTVYYRNLISAYGLFWPSAALVWAVFLLALIFAERGTSVYLFLSRKFEALPPANRLQLLILSCLLPGKGICGSLVHRKGLFLAGRILILGLLSAGLAVLFYINYFMFNHYGRGVKVVFACCAVPLAALLLIQIIPGVPQGRTRLPLLFLVVSAAAICSAHFLLNHRQEIRFFVCYRGEFLRNFVYLERLICDLDRDRYASLWAGGDPNDSDPRVNPERGDFTVPVSPRPPSEYRPRPPERMTEPRPNLIILLPDSIPAILPETRGFEPRYPRFFREHGLTLTHHYADSSATVCSLRFVLYGRYSSRYLMKRKLSPNLFDVMAENGYRRFYITARWGGQFCPENRAAVENLCVAENGRRLGGKEITDRVVELLDRGPTDSPVVVFIHYEETHFDWLPQKEGRHFGSDPLGKFLHVYDFADIQIERILRSVLEHDWLRSSIVLLTTDHGCEFMQHGLLYQGLHVYEESIRVPCMLAGVGVGRGKLDFRTRHLDITPTLIELLGLRTSLSFHGRSVAEWIRRPELPPPAEPTTVFGCSEWEDTFFLLKGYDKLIFDRLRNTYQLYDLLNDPLEKDNTVDRRREVFLTLRDGLLGIIKAGIGTYVDPDLSRETPGAGGDYPR